MTTQSQVCSPGGDREALSLELASGLRIVNDQMAVARVVVEVERALEALPEGERLPRALRLAKGVLDALSDTLVHEPAADDSGALMEAVNYAEDARATLATAIDALTEERGRRRDLLAKTEPAPPALCGCGRLPADCLGGVGCGGAP